MWVHPTALIISAGAEGCSRNYQGGGKKKKVITADVAATASLCDNNRSVVVRFTLVHATESELGDARFDCLNSAAVTTRQN